MVCLEDRNLETIAKCFNRRKKVCVCVWGVPSLLEPWFFSPDYILKLSKVKKRDVFLFIEGGRRQTQRTVFLAHS